MSTPEGRVKKRVRELLDRYDGLYHYWPVPSGYGRRTLDVIGCFRGRFFAIETKAPGEKPTKIQAENIATILNAGGEVFVIDGESEEHLARLSMWLKVIDEAIKHVPITSPSTDRRPF